MFPVAVLRWWTIVLFSHLQQLQKEPQSENEGWMEMAGKQKRRWSSSSWFTEIRASFICSIRTFTRWPYSKCVKWHKAACSVFYLSVCLLAHNTNNSLGRIGVAFFVFLCEMYNAGWTHGKRTAFILKKSYSSSGRCLIQKPHDCWKALVISQERFTTQAQERMQTNSPFKITTSLWGA